MRIIRVEPGVLEDAANKVEQSCDDYDFILTKLYNDVDRMQTSWTGKDNVAFTDQLRNYQDSMIKISAVMRQYVMFLRNSARAYKETQDELFNQAGRLRV